MGRAESAPLSAISAGVNPDISIFRPENIPLLELVPLELPPLGETGLLNTAGHELNHALVARGLGINVAMLSVKREGDSLGRTYFSGIINPELFQIVAAAGAVSPLFGKASGYSHDQFQVGMIDVIHKRKEFGTSFSFALSNAERILAGISSEVRKKAARIIAYLGDVSGNMIGAIIKRAAWEVEMESMGKLDFIKQLYVNNRPKEQQNPEIELSEEKKFTVIEYFSNGFKHYEKYNGETKCGICGGINGHAPDCRPRSYKYLPSRDTIFSLS